MAVEPVSVPQRLYLQRSNEATPESRRKELTDLMSVEQAKNSPSFSNGTKEDEVAVRSQSQKIAA